MDSFLLLLAWVGVGMVDADVVRAAKEEVDLVRTSRERLIEL